MSLNKIQDLNILIKPRNAKYIVVCTYLIFVSANLRAHELWRDELQAWLIAKVSSNPIEVVSNVRYEGRPPLWHEVLWVLTRISESPDSIKILNLLLVSCAAILISRIKILNTFALLGLFFGFYFAYGYSAVSRDYTLILFLISLLAYSESKYNHKVSKIVVGCLIFTNIFGLMFAIGYLTLLAYRTAKIGWKIGNTVEAFLYLGLVSLAMYLIVPPANSNIFSIPSPGLFSDLNEIQIRRAILSIAMPLFPFHEPSDLSKIAMLILVLLAWLVLSYQSKIFITPIIFLVLLNGHFFFY